MMPIPNRLDGRAPRCACRRLARANTRSPMKPRLGFFQRKFAKGVLRDWLTACGIEEFRDIF
jgi:hypothetical protein